MAWTGSVTGGVAGTTSAAFKEDVRRRINFYRALVGLACGHHLRCDEERERSPGSSADVRPQRDLSHQPPTEWIYYTPNASDAAGASNIALGTYGPGSVDAYMRDDGSNNIIVGHRRWLHYSQGQSDGDRRCAGEGSYNRANAIWVIGDFKAPPAPKFVAWPNRGYVPFSLVPDDGRFPIPGANFESATVTMTQGAINISDNCHLADGQRIRRQHDRLDTNHPALLRPDRTPLYNVTVASISGSGVPTATTTP